ncbi:hypothetical protein TrRE_jg2998, partial [Triparma retinervis]
MIVTLRRENKRNNGAVRLQGSREVRFPPPERRRVGVRKERMFDPEVPSSEREQARAVQGGG